MNNFKPSSLKSLCAVVAFAVGPVQLAHAQVTNQVAVPSGCTTEERDINADCRRGPAPAAGKTPKESAPTDLTGYWVAVITEDWRWRMLTPPKGDYASLPISAEGKKLADAWNPADVGSCKPFGAPGLMRNPLRVKFEWTDDSTLKAQTDHGEQTRLFHFSPVASEAPSLQGTSAASWDQSGLKVVTTNLTPGYLRKNGVPYSDKTKLTEYYNRYSAFGEDWLTITTIVEDPVYLTREFVTSLDFKKLKDDGASWKPVPCKAT